MKLPVVACTGDRRWTIIYREEGGGEQKRVALPPNELVHELHLLPYKQYVVKGDLAGCAENFTTPGQNVYTRGGLFLTRSGLPSGDCGCRVESRLIIINRFDYSNFPSQSINRLPA